MKRKKFQNRSMVMNDIGKKIMDVHFNLYLIYNRKDFFITIIPVMRIIIKMLHLLIMN